MDDLQKRLLVFQTYCEGMERRSAGLAEMLMRPDLQPEIEAFFGPQEALEPIINKRPFYYFVMMILKNALCDVRETFRPEMFLPMEAITQDVRARMVAAMDGAVYDDDYTSEESRLAVILGRVKRNEVKGSRKHRAKIFRESDDSLTEFMDTLASFRAWGLFLDTSALRNEGRERLASIFWKHVAEFCSRNGVPQLPQNVTSLILPQDLAAMADADEAEQALAEMGISDAELDRVMRIQSVIEIREELGGAVNDLTISPFVAAHEQIDAEANQAANAEFHALTEESLAFLVSHYPDPQELFHVLANTSQLLTLSSRLSVRPAQQGE